MPWCNYIWICHFKSNISYKVENIRKIRSHHLHLQWKFKLLPGKFTWGNKAKSCWVMSTNFLFSKVCWQRPAMFLIYTSSKLSCQSFEFSLKMKVMELNPDYLLKSFLLYMRPVYMKWNWFYVITSENFCT